MMTWKGLEVELSLRSSTKHSDHALVDTTEKYDTTTVKKRQRAM